MGDTKALLFLTYEGNRGRTTQNRLRHLAPRMTNRPPRLRAWNDPDPSAEPAAHAPASEPSIEAAELVSDLVAFARSNPDVAASILRYAERREALLGESGADAEELKGRVRESKS